METDYERRANVAFTALLNVSVKSTVVSSESSPELHEVLRI